ncbi:MAG: PatB family C-S lyase [Gammaproteobacteria bacterium]|nr:PatB family C-S lyase [Gammaproteobacteria bacterium]
MSNSNQSGSGADWPSNSPASRPVIRTPGDGSIAALRRKHGGKWNRYGSEVLPAWVADMDFELAEPLRVYLEERIEAHDLGYPMKAADDPLPAVFCDRMQSRYGWQPDVDGVEVIIDVVQGIYVLLHTLTEPGEGAIIQTPIYPPFLSSVRETGRRGDLNPLRRLDDRWEIDFEHLRSVIKPDTRWLFLCNPHNPSGRVFTRDELEALAEIVLEHDLKVLADEIHADLVFDGRRHIPFASLSAEIARRTVTMTSTTKSFNTAGLRCAIAHFGDPALKARFNSLPARIRGGLSTFGVALTRIAWQHCDDWQQAVLQTLQDNRDLLARTLKRDFPEVHYILQEGTYLAWLDCNAAGLGEDPASFFLREAKVALNPGPDFGAQGAGCARFNFATSAAIMTTMLGQMRAALDARG